MTGIECILLIPFTLNFKKLDRPSRWACYYLISSVVFAVGSFAFAHLYRNNLWFYSIMYYIQFVILSIYYSLLIKNPLFRRLIKILPIPAAAIFLLDFFKLEGVLAYNSIFAAARTFILLCYGTVFFIQLLFDEELVKEAIFVNALPNFWFNAGLFIFFSCSFFDTLTYNFFLKHYKTHNNLVLSLVFLGGIIEGILFYIGLMKAKKQRP